MQLWRFLSPSALGFTLKTTSQALIDKIKGAPVRPVQVENMWRNMPNPMTPKTCCALSTTLPGMSDG